ncbi:hypothetical protein BCR37DRAFT_393699 [Protomyces lactucae-debilis]|uniref:DUF3752 domain-containing protein n=1 Tax=Protomyces lactucae-debilis TaxID=2754530 RepID=A0A1Y2F8T9_PROLT|nr:uncharacterized protein BCR37DRAFT_393699 [Protomyces lactucae-debilis]ORY80332.1 hypothetical protein BCR37DRAFT_393699 [Protomyces lactucae-debilis]
MVGPALPPDLLAAREKQRQARATKLSEATTTEAATITHTDDSERSKAPPISSQGKGDANALINESDEEEDDDVGPMLPGDTAREALYAARSSAHQGQDDDSGAISTSATGKRQHSDWMTQPPSKGDWAQSIDTTKLKSRQFASSKPGRPGPHQQGGFDAGWTSVAGEEVSRAGETEAEEGPEWTAAAAIELQKRQEAEKAQASQNRGPSMYEQHTLKRKHMSKEDRDDPSSRPFDRSKDIGSGVSSKRTRELAQRSKDMSSMFGESKFL